MSDYRIEQLRIRLSSPIDGLDPNQGLDAEELCWIDPTGVDAQLCGAIPLSDFYIADLAQLRKEERWFSANEGLNSVDKLLRHYQRVLASGSDPLGREAGVIRDKVKQLESVRKVLSCATEHGAGFYFAVIDP